MATLFELKENIATLKAAIAADGEYLASKAADPNVDMSDIEAKQAHQENLKKRLKILEAQAADMEAAQKAAVQKTAAKTEKDDIIAKKAAFYRAALERGDIRKTYEGLGALPASSADLGTGEKILPTNMRRELVMEPVDENPVRSICQVTNVKGLEEPKLGYEIEDADLADVLDTATAKEIALEGDVIAYGRHKCKVTATVKDTVLHGTDVDLVNAVENILRSAVAKREKMLAFRTHTAIYNSGTVDTARRHMSFYNYTGDYSASTPTYAITAKEGATMYAAIAAALGDLADEFAAHASVVMRKADYYAMIQSLTNDSEALFGSKPAAILGVPVVFCDKAVIPVVGDFRYYGINYDIDTMFVTDMDAKKGEYYFVVTAWGDQQIRLKSAFRLAIVNP